MGKKAHSSQDTAAGLVRDRLRIVPLLLLGCHVADDVVVFALESFAQVRTGISVLGFLDTQLHLARFNIFVELFTLLLLAFNLLKHIIQGFMDYSTTVLRHFLIVGVFLKGISHLRSFVSRAFSRVSALLTQSGEDIGDKLFWVIFVPLLQDTFRLNERLRDF